MNPRPLVSVITIFLNGERFIREAIESVFAQTYDNWEYLLVDDGSTDASTALARQYAERYPGKVRYLEHEGHVNRGMSATRNLGIRHAQGKYVALLDADDVWLPQKLTRQVAILEAHPRAAMVYGANQYWHSWTGLSEDVKRDHIPELGVSVDTLFEPGTLSLHVYPLGQAAAPCPSDLLIRRDIFARIGGFEESFISKYQMYEDQAFLAKVYLKEAVFVSGECWDKYRIHPDSCVAMVNKAGEYYTVRLFFLQWLQKYLAKEQVANPQILTSLQTATEQCRGSLADGASEGHASGSSLVDDVRRQVWRLRVGDGNRANLEFSSDNPDAVRIAIEKAGTGINFDVQLNKPGLTARKNDHYLVNFLARADKPRRIFVGFARTHAPWNGLGCYREITLTTMWQSFAEEFIVTEDESDGRIHFDLGESDISVDISTVTLRNLTGGKFVNPDPPLPVQLSTSETECSEPLIPVGKVQFGSLRRVTPISRDWGWDRGLPIDRYYVEKFLAAYSADIQGRVLEIGDNSYTRQFGGNRVVISDVLHVAEGNPAATIVGDLASADHIPSNSFDCIILTQTLQLIYDVPAALKTIHRILKPHGVLLATFPGISQTYDDEWSEHWFWNFTLLSARRLFSEVFPLAHLQIEAFGNVAAAISFLHGIASEELSPAELNQREAGYDVTITVRAVKPPEVGTMRADEPSVPTVHQLSGSHNAKALILMYHSIAEVWPDPWGLSVTPKHFDEQLEVLKKYAHPIGLYELGDKLEEKRIPPNAVVVTFDDGYANNLYTAKPILVRYEIPATVFLATGSLGQARGFWWNEIEQLALQPGALPKKLRLNVNGDTMQWDLGDVAAYQGETARQYRFWKAWEEPPTPRHAFYFSLWQQLQGLREEERQRALAAVRVWAHGERPNHPIQQVLSVEEVKELAADGLVDIGAHTVTHSVLSQLPVAEQREEILQSKRILEEILGRKVTSFAYPYGAATTYTMDAVAAVRETGFHYACATKASAVTTASDRFQLPRFQVLDWDGDEFAHQLSLWFNS